MREKSDSVIAVLMKEITAFSYPKIFSMLERLVGVFSHLINNQHEKHCILKTVDLQPCCGKEKAAMNTKAPEDEWEGPQKSNDPENLS